MWCNSVANFCSRSESSNLLIVVFLGIGNAGLIFEVLAAFFRLKYFSEKLLCCC